MTAILPELSNEERHRYGRHVILPDLGEDGQRRLKAAQVLLIGAGGLGSPAALYLAAAGIGTLGIADDDVVEESNLHRQILYGTSAVGRAKIDAARERLYDVNPHVEVTPHAERLTSANALALLARYDIIVDGADNFPTRYLVNDACVLLGKPNVHGSIHHFDGQASVFAAPDGPCYRCLYPAPPPPGLVPSCAEAGVLGVLPGLVGVVQATEAIKLAAGIGEPLIGRLLLVDALRMSFRTVKLRSNPQCPSCGTREIRELVDYEHFCGLSPEVTPLQLAELLALGSVDLVDVREPHEWDVARIPGARLIPLGALPRSLGELDRGREIVVHCKSGARSARAAGILRDAGFRVRNLAGGIDRWLSDRG